MNEQNLPESVIGEIIKIVILERLRDLSQEEIYWEIAKVLEDNGLKMQEEKAYEIAKKMCSFLP